MPIAAAVPLIKLAAPFILKGLGKFFGNKGKQKQQKELQRAQQESIDNKYKSDFDTFENREDDRTMRTQGIANQLTGARALSPEVIKAALQRRRNTAYKGSVADQTKGAGTAMIGDALGGAGDIAGAMLRERAIGEAEQGMSPQFRPGAGNCPPGTQGSNGECF